MRKYLKIAFRNLFRQKKRTISLGITYTFVTILIVGLFSFSAGAVKNIRNNLAKSVSGHINLNGYERTERNFIGVISGYENIMEIIHKVFPQSEIYPRFTSNLSIYNKGYSKTLSFKGVEPSIEKNFSGNLIFVDGSWDEFLERKENILLPSNDADYLELSIGDEVVSSVRTAQGAFNTGIFIVAGIYDSSGMFVNTGAVAHHEYLRELLNMSEGSTQTLQVYFAKADKLDERKQILSDFLKKSGMIVTERRIPVNSGMRGGMGPGMMGPGGGRRTSENYQEFEEGVPVFNLQTLDEALSQIKSMTDVLNNIGLAIASVMLFIIAVALFVNIRMTVNDRMREIGTIRTMGMQGNSLVKLFILENTFLGIIFSLIGVVFAFILMTVLSLFKFSLGGQLASFLNNGHLVFAPSFLTIMLVVLAITVFSVIFSLLPSRYAGKIKPVEALAREF